MALRNPFKQFKKDDHSYFVTKEINALIKKVDRLLNHNQKNAEVFKDLVFLRDLLDELRKYRDLTNPDELAKLKGKSELMKRYIESEKSAKEIQNKIAQLGAVVEELSKSTDESRKAENTSLIEILNDAQRYASISYEQRLNHINSDRLMLIYNPFKKLDEAEHDYFIHKQVKEFRKQFESMYLHYNSPMNVKNYSSPEMKKEMEANAAALAGIINLLRALEKFRDISNVSELKGAKQVDHEAIAVAWLDISKQLGELSKLPPAVSQSVREIVNEAVEYTKKSGNQRANHLIHEGLITKTIFDNAASRDAELVRESGSPTVAIYNTERQPQLEMGEKLGAGGFGVVYTAKITDPKLKKQLVELNILKEGEDEVVIKKLLPGGKKTEEDTKNFIREGKVGAHLLAAANKSKTEQVTGKSLDATIDGMPVVLCRKEERGNVLDYFKKLSFNEGSSRNPFKDLSKVGHDYFVTKQIDKLLKQFESIMLHNKFESTGETREQNYKMFVEIRELLTALKNFREATSPSNFKKNDPKHLRQILEQIENITDKLKTFQKFSKDYEHDHEISKLLADTAKYCECSISQRVNNLLDNKYITENSLKTYKPKEDRPEIKDLSPIIKVTIPQIPHKHYQTTDRRELLTRVFSDLFQNLNFIHDNNVVHSDIAARNVCLGKRHAVIIDNGKGIITNGDPNDPALAERGSGNNVPILWTGQDFFKNRQYSQQNDLFAFKVTLLEIMAAAAGLDHMKLFGGVDPGHGNLNYYFTTLEKGDAFVIGKMCEQLEKYLKENSYKNNCQEVREVYEKLKYVLTMDPRQFPVAEQKQAMARSFEQLQKAFLSEKDRKMYAPPPVAKEKAVSQRRSDYSSTSSGFFRKERAPETAPETAPTRPLPVNSRKS